MAKDVSHAVRMNKDLECKPFAYFLHRFRGIYKNSGMLPDQVFHIRSRSSKKCISRNGGGYTMRDCNRATKFHQANMRPEGFPSQDDAAVFGGPRDAPKEGGNNPVVCGGHQAKSCAECVRAAPHGDGAGWCHADCAWVFGQCVDVSVAEQMEERSKSDPQKCCSGIRDWNSLDCWDTLNNDGPSPYFCDVTGKNANQQYIWAADGRLRHWTGKCVSEVPKRDKLRSHDCADSTEWEKIDIFEPPETRIYNADVKKLGLSEDSPDV
ncbi:unnamed protein product [Polarella glacialis]|uniref:Uncharacterized protein n=1 Tax=Polarella glacialis TaxID=89957 RepID=A0A813GA17_POLGL|nr:unnamed protein product [Polarella glacialis]